MPNRLLLVEDDINLADVWITRFKMLNFEVHHSDRMDEALQLFKAHPIDVVVTDFHLQQGSGRKLLQEVRKINPEMPVFLMTGTPYVEKEDFSIYKFNDVFLKPFPSDQLIQAVLAVCPAKN